MNDQQPRTIEALNRLFAAERRSLLPRLMEAGAFVSWASTGDAALVHKMVQEQQEHLAWLAEAMDRCCGVLYPAGPDVHTAHLHYMDLHALLPQVIRDVENLLRVYQEAGKQPLTAPAGEIVNRILLRHHRHLDQLRTLQDHAATANA